MFIPINMHLKSSLFHNFSLAMEKSNFHILFSLLLVLPLLVSCAEKQVYIVHFGVHNGDKTIQEVEDSHHSYLLSVKETEEDAKASLVYSYKHSINGFAGLLTPDEASKLSEMEGVVSIYPSNPRKYSMHTTRSWEFSGLQETRNSMSLDKDDLLMKSRYGKDVIVGLLDNGVWPESKSFSDEGMGPIPKHWKGICQSGDLFNSSHCNKKIIGARYYIKGYQAYYGSLNRTIDYLSPRDMDGHGTHTASTATGRRVRNVSAFGFASGTASGGAPLSRLAIYKVCWAVPGHMKADGNTCFEEDMLAAIDDAIADGVDVLSISIGTSTPTPFGQDGIAMGALHAVKKNIVVACSAGNSGPKAATLSNTAPWIITVGASSVDREFISTLLLGNGDKIEGQTVTPFQLGNKFYPLVYAAQVENPNVPKNVSGQCLPNSLSSKKAKGKIVMCIRGNGTRVGKGFEVKRAGGIGYILGNGKANGEELTVDAHILPATAVGYTNAMKIINYISSANSSATASISPAKTVYDNKPAPFMAGFTSRGPSVVSPDILKPDITAPGLNILAAWSEADSPTKLDTDPRRVKYNILSGTSMSCPHIGGASALLKAMHPTWSSAAIRSALVTSAGLTNNNGKPITDASGNPADPFQFGSGHFRPTKAADPGLVYDATYKDYLSYLCGIGLQNLDKNFKCPKKQLAPGNLNYPSLAIPNLNGTMTFTRTVTNVGSSKSVYFASVKPPSGFSVKISPSVLHFNRVGQKKKFSITVKAESGKEKGEYEFGWYTWNDGVHNVRSPMAVSLA